MSVVEVYRTFLHREPEGSYRLTLPRYCHAPAEAAELGLLLGLYGTWGKYEYQNEWEPGHKARLLCTSRGRLYCYCPLGSLVSGPVIERVIYRADKGEGMGKVNYYHDFNRNDPPRLVAPVGSDGELARLEGGGYSIEVEGIVG